MLGGHVSVREWVPLASSHIAERGPCEGAIHPVLRIEIITSTVLSIQDDRGCLPKIGLVTERRSGWAVRLVRIRLLRSMGTKV